MPVNENSAEDLNTLLGLIRNHSQSNFNALVGDLCVESEKLFFRNVRAQEAIHALSEEKIALQHAVDELKQELANLQMLYNAASSTVLATNQLLDTAEHKVEALRTIASPMPIDDDLIVGGEILAVGMLAIGDHVAMKWQPQGRRGVVYAFEAGQHQTSVVVEWGSFEKPSRTHEKPENLVWVDADL